MNAVDQAIIVNIFPYWENASIAQARAYLDDHIEIVANMSNEYGKEVWLGETGWPSYDHVAHNIHGTSSDNARNYFQQFGCQILEGRGTAFYYVDWDEDNYNSSKPVFGLFDVQGQPTIDLDCRKFKTDTNVKPIWPKWWGGQS